MSGPGHRGGPGGRAEPAQAGGSTERGAVYCWVPHPREKDQTTVAQQEVLARERADRLGVAVDARHVFVDTLLTAWSPGRSRPGWEAMLAAARAAEFRHLFMYRAERLDRHACAFAELLDLLGTHALLLHGHTRDLNDPAERARALGRARRACLRARGASERARTARQATAAAGTAHGGGLRRYGYLPGMAGLMEDEAAIVREIFSRFLAGTTLRALALDLNARGVPTAYGRPWTVGGVGRIIDAPRYAGLTVRGGEVLRSPDGQYLPAAWPACVPVADWEAARVLRRQRAQDLREGRRPNREYPLTSLVWCTRCDRRMVGSMVGRFPTYACTSNSSLESGHCSRHIGAERLEAYVHEEAVLLLETLDSAGRQPRVTGTGAPPGRGAPARDAHRAVVVRRADALDGVATGPGARFGWGRLSPARKAEVVRYLFAAILVSESSTVRSVFDTGRIELVRHV